MVSGDASHSSSGCIFCTLSASDKDKLYEDEHAFLIADINPLARGHLLLVTKKHYEYLDEMDDSDMSSILPTIKRIVKALGYSDNDRGYNVLQNNRNIQSVNHVHFHIIPKNGQNERLDVKWECIHVSKDDIKAIQDDVRGKLKRV